MFRIPKKYMNWNIRLKMNKRYPIVIPYTLYWLYRLLNGNIYAETLVCDKNGLMWDNKYLRHDYVKCGHVAYKILSFEIMNIKGKDEIVIWVDPNDYRINN
jgi:hypothetical protein